MIRYVIGKLGEALVAVWGVVTIVFFVTRLLGDPAALLLPVGASAEQLDAFRASLGLDLPLWEQYLSFLAQAVQGDFGQSFLFNRPAITVVLERMPATITLAVTAMVFGVLIGGGAGAIAATQRGKFAEFAVMTLALLGQATPVFWLGIMLILFFAVDLGWLPTGGYGSLSHLILPAFTLAVFVSASIARLLRSSLLDSMKEDYVRTARAKGLPPGQVFVWHALRNALIPVVTMVGILSGELLGGSVVTETVFAWPGVGRLIVQAIESKDFPVVQAGVAVIATVYVSINFLVDLLYGVLDPRIRRKEP
ncbi:MULTISPECIES: ABC transporter permease [unclassified Chelatococcus]|uniref:ABC transporter permease n=1 Tax=unclassified Chelatococcus TaxID=2638111 RepID=UPI001BCBC0F4|nr:ABC transporter permease [Chelatococcus sp.]MBS7740068.1 ABC transporter permease [Chelatococcus sp. HY11]CAH1653059.1 Glutathione transport system permease protein GsiC [Hyphomicrobiales bacterium]MBX3545103.1 ABC transporter permease [Chelatococcus sp.]MCO5078631.1 ABC transporter permease [Chelatococcus sp.]CAH1685808.1 Glutathione transport system permease protein GsiC [Hyphomicrobiales bacterium]